MNHIKTSARQNEVHWFLSKSIFNHKGNFFFRGLFFCHRDVFFCEILLSNATQQVVTEETMTIKIYLRKKIFGFILKESFTNYVDKTRLVGGTGNVNGMQISPYNTSIEIHSPLPTKGKQVVNNLQNLVNIVKEQPQIANFLAGGDAAPS